MTKKEFGQDEHWEYGPSYTSKQHNYTRRKDSPLSLIDDKGHFSNQIYYQINENLKVFTDEEVDRLNQEENEANEKGLEIALSEGFIEIPITFRNIHGELVDMKAWVHPSFEPSNTPGFKEKHGMEYNIYIPTYDRAEKNWTGEMLEKQTATNYYFFIDPSRFELYRKYWPIERFILRDIRFDEPDMVELGQSVRRPNYMAGTAGVYNSMLAFSRSIGEKKYWTIDDDIVDVAMKARKGDKTAPGDEAYDKDNYYRCSALQIKHGWSFTRFMNSIEEVANQVRNPGFMGLEKLGIAFSNPIHWKLGTRVYSYYLSDNATQITHRKAMNNDVIASFEQARRQTPPALFEGICYSSMPTQSGGGLTEQYRMLGTLEKGKILIKAQPSISRIHEAYHRIHHRADFSDNVNLRFVGKPLDPDNETLYYQAND